MREPTQLQRVLKYASRTEGVTQVDFCAPAIDGWKPILRVGARIDDLKRRGYVFESLGIRDRCKIYRLVASPERDVEGSRSTPGPTYRHGACVPDPDAAAVPLSVKPLNPYEFDLLGEAA